MKSSSNPQQLRLVDPARTWRIDPRTREIGRVGVEKARLVLQHSLTGTAESDDQRDDTQAA